MEGRKVCICGRSYTHCRNCGSRNIYAKRYRSLEFSAALGRQVTVFGCRRCSEETNETEPCNAPAREFKSGFQPYQKPPELPPWGILIPGSNEYAAALVDAAIKMTEKRTITLIQAYVELKKQGWQPELYDMDVEVKEALSLAGLLNNDQSVIKEQEAPMRGAQEVQSPPVSEEPLGLEEIIKNMQENSK